MWGGKWVASYIYIIDEKIDKCKGKYPISEKRSSNKTNESLKMQIKLDNSEEEAYNKIA